MTTTIVIVVAVLAIVLVIVMLRRRGGQRDAAEVVRELRLRALRLVPADVGIEPVAGEAWGVVMDTTYPTASASLIALIDGTASIYFSTGGGVIGGQTHETAAEAAKAFVREASRHLERLVPAQNEDLPPVGHTRFFVLTPEGTRVAEALEDDLGEGTHELSPLFYAGQEVITQLRLLSENR